MAATSSSSVQLKSCETKECKRMSRALCHCCSQNLCIVHLKQHADALDDQLNPLVDEINDLHGRLSQLNGRAIVEREHANLQEWRQEGIAIVNSFYEHSCRQLEEFVDETLMEQRQEIKDLRDNVNELTRNQDVTQNDIDWISENIDKTRKQICAQETAECLVHIGPLVIDKRLIQIGWFAPKVIPFDISRLPEPYLSKYFDEDCAYRGMAVTEDKQHLLVYDKNSLYLFDHLLRTEKQIKWHDGYITHMCHASSVNKFILLGSRMERSGVFTLEIDTMKIDKILDGTYKYGACSDTHLYLSKDEYKVSTALDQYKLSNFELCRFHICTKDESIDYMAYHSNMLALIIFNCRWNKYTHEVQPRIEVRLTNGKLEKLWSIPITFSGGTLAQTSIASLKTLGWLITDTGDTCRRLIHISKDGKLQSTFDYKHVHGYPMHTMLLGENSLVVKTLHYCWSGEVKNRTAINLHKLYLYE